MSIDVAAGSGRQALHPPSPSTISSAAMRKSEEEGLHLRPLGSDPPVVSFVATARIREEWHRSLCMHFTKKA